MEPTVPEKAYDARASWRYDRQFDFAYGAEQLPPPAVLSAKPAFTFDAGREGTHRMRRCFSRIAARFALAALAMASCSGCTEEKSLAPPPPLAELKPVVGHLDRQYRAKPLGKGWTVASVSAQGSQVLITVEIPPDQASPIKRLPADDQFRLVAKHACPGRDAAAWRLLPAGSVIKVLPSVSGQVFIEVDCTSSAQGIP